MTELDQLAGKLGVAVEHLWGVLLRQAPISGYFDILFYVFTAASVYATYRLWVFIHNKVKGSDGYCGWDEVSYIWPAFASIVVFSLVIASLASMPITAAAFFNQEYWALHQVLRAVK